MGKTQEQALRFKSDIYRVDSDSSQARLLHLASYTFSIDKWLAIVQAWLWPMYAIASALMVTYKEGRFFDEISRKVQVGACLSMSACVETMRNSDWTAVSVQIQR